MQSTRHNEVDLLADRILFLSPGTSKIAFFYVQVSFIQAFADTVVRGREDFFSFFSSSSLLFTSLYICSCLNCYESISFMLLTTCVREGSGICLNEL